MQRTAELAESKVPQDWLWQGRHVILLDGLVVDAPDTTENQAVYPQPSSQKPGLGFLKSVKRRLSAWQLAWC